MKYLIKTNVIYRVPTVAEALQIREQLSKQKNSSLTSFSYNTKYIKEKGEIIEEYQLIKATLEFNDEKEPESTVDIIIKGDTENE